LSIIRHVNFYVTILIWQLHTVDLIHHLHNIYQSYMYGTAVQ